MELIWSLVSYMDYKRTEVTYKGSLATLLSSLKSMQIQMFETAVTAIRDAVNRCGPDFHQQYRAAMTKGVGGFRTKIFG